MTTTLLTYTLPPCLSWMALDFAGVTQEDEDHDAAYLEAYEACKAADIREDMSGKTSAVTLTMSAAAWACMVDEFDTLADADLEKEEFGTPSERRAAKALKASWRKAIAKLIETLGVERIGY